MSKTSENTDKLCKFISEKFTSGELENDSLVQIIELCGAYLNLQSISDYAKKHGKSYNGVKKFRRVEKILGQKFVIENS